MGNLWVVSIKQFNSKIMTRMGVSNDLVLHEGGFF